MKHALRCELNQRITTIREQHASGGKLVRHQIQHSMCNFLIIPHPGVNRWPNAPTFQKTPKPLPLFDY